jgi:lipoate-protein ligase A
LAVDEALFAWVCRGGVGRPGLRTYRWDREAVSIGYAYPLGALGGWEHGVLPPVVRRITGGGSVEHGSDVALALYLPGRDVPGGAGVTGFYRWVHALVAEALRVAGLAGVGLAAACVGGPVRGGACFASPVRDDVVDAGGRKLAGGAVRRARGGWLYQGSVRGAGLDPDMLAKSLATAVAPIRNPEPGLPGGAADAAARLEEERYRNGDWLGRC